MTENCILCGEKLPPRRWWQSRWLLGQIPMHRSDGKEGAACKARMLILVGATPVEIDPRECGWMGCGHPRCERICGAVPLDEWRAWKDAQ